jgi:hypothetical protein
MMSAAGEGEAFAGAAGGEEPGDTEAGLPGQVLAVARLAEPEFVVEITGKENNPTRVEPPVRREATLSRLVLAWANSCQATVESVEDTCPSPN